MVRAVAVLGGCVLLAGCVPDTDTPRASSGAIERTVDAPADTVVSAESGLLAVAADLHVHPDGRLLVSDVINHVVRMFAPDGAHVGTLGRQGQGPGELLLPTGLQTLGDSILVVDGGNQRIQVFTSEGEFLEGRTWPGFRPPVIGPTGTLVQPTLGLDSTLAVIRRPDGEEVTRIGTPLAAATPIVSMTEMKDEIENGDVPGIFLNTATALIDDDDAVWLLVSAAARIERYSPSGEPLVSVTLDEPEFEDARSEFVRRNREAGPNQVFQLEYFRGAEVVGPNLWILLPPREGNGTRMLVVSRTGATVEEIRFPQVNGAGAFTVDEDRDVAYFFIPEEASLLRVGLN